MFNAEAKYRIDVRGMEITSLEWEDTLVIPINLSIFLSLLSVIIRCKQFQVPKKQ